MCGYLIFRVLAGPWSQRGQNPGFGGVLENGYFWLFLCFYRSLMIHWLYITFIDFIVKIFFKIFEIFFSIFFQKFLKIFKFLPKFGKKYNATFLGVGVPPGPPGPGFGQKSGQLILYEHDYREQSSPVLLLLSDAGRPFLGFRGPLPKPSMSHYSPL